jgi:hypothetical protein
VGKFIYVKNIKTRREISNLVRNTIKKYHLNIDGYVVGKRDDYGICITINGRDETKLYNLININETDKINNKIPTFKI